MKTPLLIILSVVLAAGAVAANQLGAQTSPAAPATATTPTGAPAAASIATVQNVVEITRAVPAGPTAVDVFTVPAGVMLVVTDIVVTNTGTAAACGGAVNRAGGAATVGAPAPAAGTTGTPTATTPTLTPPVTTAPATTPTVEGATQPGASASAPAPTATTSLGTLTQTDSTVTGPLCVPAQTTTTLPLTTGIEFGSGQVVQLLNAPAPVAGTTGPVGAPGSLAFHLRGVLVTLS